MARVFVLRSPFEVALDVREAEERLGADVIEAGHPGQADLKGNRYVALGLLGAPPGRLGDDLDQRRHRVRVGFDVEHAVRIAADRDEAEREQDRDRGSFEDEVDNLLDHGSPTEASRPTGWLRRSRSGRPSRSRAPRPAICCLRLRPL